MGVPSKAQIEINFKNIMEKADKLEGLSEEISKAAKHDLNEVLNNIGANWTGENASAYLSKGGLLKNNLERTALELLSVASSLRSAAKKMYQAEMNAIEIAKSRTYSGAFGEDNDGNGGGGFR